KAFMMHRKWTGRKWLIPVNPREIAIVRVKERQDTEPAKPDSLFDQDHVFEVAFMNKRKPGRDRGSILEVWTVSWSVAAKRFGGSAVRCKFRAGFNGLTKAGSASVVRKSFPGIFGIRCPFDNSARLHLKIHVPGGGARH